MALTRKFLTALAIEEEKAEQIITAHTETTDGLKAERDKYKADAELLPTVRQELEDLKAAVEKNGNDPYKVKYEAMKEEFENYKKEIESKEATAKKETAFRSILKEIGVAEKRIDAVVKVSNIDEVELDSQGNLKNGDKLKESLKEEWSDFIATTKKEGAPTAKPPITGDGKPTMTKEQIRAISDPIARQKAMLDNPTLFGLPDNSN